MRRPLSAALGLLVVASAAQSAEFLPGWTVDGNWSSNVFRTADEDLSGRKIPKEDDFSVRTGPNVRLRDRTGDVTYDLDYTLRYEAFLRLDGINDWDHFANGRGDWSIDDRTSLSVSDSFADSASLSGLLDTNTAAAIAVVTGVRSRITTNDASASLRRRLG